MWLYLTPERPERYVSASSVLKGSGEDIAPLINGNIVFVGTSAAGLLDIRATPLGQNVPGVSLHAQALEQILTQTFLSRPDWADGLEVAMVAAVGMLVASMIALFRRGSPCRRAWPCPAHFSRSHGMRSAHWGFLIDPVAPILASTLAQFATVGFSLLITDRERRHIRRAFGNYVSPAVLARAENQPNALRLGGDDREITMMFMDVREFTTISEGLHAHGLVAFLNKLLTGLSRHVIESEGTLDKFIGDSIMAFWNAPVDVDEHPARAARCALRMRESLREMNAYRRARDRPAGWHRHRHQHRHRLRGRDRSREPVQLFRRRRCREHDRAHRIDVQGVRLRHPGVGGNRLEAEGLCRARGGFAQPKGQIPKTDIYLLVGDEAAASTPEFESLKRAHGEFVVALSQKEPDRIAEAARAASAVSAAILPGLERYYALASGGPHK